MVRRIISIAAFLALLSVSPAGADQVAAEQLMKAHERKVELWMSAMADAENPKTRDLILTRRPDEGAQLERLWRQVENHLDEGWVIDPLAWMLARPAAWVGIPEGERVGAFNAVMDAIEHALIINPDLGKLMPALANLEHQRCLGVVNKVISTNPSDKVKASAHVAAAIILRRIGDAPKIMNQRREHLRKALELGGDAPFGRGLVIDVVKDELYRVKNLNVGKQSPTFSLRDQDDLEVNLLNYRSRVTVLVFWSLDSSICVQSVPTMNALLADLGALKDNVAMLGVVNNAPSELREFLKKNEMTFDNLVDPGGRVTHDYRVDILPMVYILDQQGRVAYKGELSPLLRPKIEELAVTGESSGVLPAPRP